MISVTTYCVWRSLARACWSHDWYLMCMAGDCGLLRSRDYEPLPHYEEALGGSVLASPFVISYTGLAGVPKGSLVA